MSEIFDNLFIGSYLEGTNFEFLKKKRITHVLCVAEELEPTAGVICLVRHIKIPFLKTCNISQYITEGIKLIEEGTRNSNKILVYCSNGDNRAVAISIAYMINSKGLSFIESLFTIKSKRITAQLSVRFIDQLKLFEKSLKKLQKYKSTKKLPPLELIPNQPNNQSPKKLRMLRAKRAIALIISKKPNPESWIRRRSKSDSQKRERIIFESKLNPNSSVSLPRALKVSVVESKQPSDPLQKHVPLPLFRSVILGPTTFKFSRLGNGQFSTNNYSLGL